MTSLFSSSQRPLRIMILLLIVVGFALALRVVTLRDSSFFGDNFEDFAATKQWVELGRIPPVGTRISGTEACMPGSGLYGLLAIPYLLTQSFRGLQMLAFLLAVLTAALAIRFVWEKSSPLIALYFSILLLFNPYFVIMSSGYWNPHLLLLFAALTWGILIDIELGGDRPLAYLALMPMAALMAQFHFITAFITVPLLLVFLFPYRRRPSFKYFGWGILAAALLFVPYLIDEAGNGFSNTRAMFATSGKTARFLAAPRLDIFLLFPSNEFSFFLGRKASVIFDFYLKQGIIGIGELAANAVTLLISLAANLLAAALFIPGVRSRFRALSAFELLPWERAGLRLGYLSLAVIAVTFLAFRVPAFHLHYYYVIFLLSFVPLLVSFRFLAQWRLPLARGVLVFTIVSATLASAAVLRYYELYEKPISFSRQTEITGAILEDARGRRFALRSNYDLASKDRFYETMAAHFLGKAWNRDDASPLVYQIASRAYDRHFRPLAIDPRMSLVWERDGIALYKMDVAAGQP
jgi:hypothetical protein